jgi:hypothetical protein
VSFELPKISEPLTATQLRQPVLMQLTLMAAGNGKPPAKLRTGATSEPRLEAEPLARQGQDRAAAGVCGLPALRPRTEVLRSSPRQYLAHHSLEALPSLRLASQRPLRSPLRRRKRRHEGERFREG